MFELKSSVQVLVIFSALLIASNDAHAAKLRAKRQFQFPAERTQGLQYGAFGNRFGTGALQFGPGTGYPAPPPVYSNVYAGGNPLQPLPIQTMVQPLIQANGGQQAPLYNPNMNGAYNAPMPVAFQQQGPGITYTQNAQPVVFQGQLSPTGSSASAYPVQINQKLAESAYNPIYQQPATPSSNIPPSGSRNGYQPQENGFASPASSVQAVQSSVSQPTSQYQASTTTETSQESENMMSPVTETTTTFTTTKTPDTTTVLTTVSTFPPNPTVETSTMLQELSTSLPASTPPSAKTSVRPALTTMTIVHINASGSAEQFVPGLVANTTVIPVAVVETTSRFTGATAPPTIPVAFFPTFESTLPTIMMSTVTKMMHSKTTVSSTTTPKSHRVAVPKLGRSLSVPRKISAKIR